MDDLRKKADSGPDAVRLEDAIGQSFRVQNPALYDADAISEEGSYPKYGDWLETENGFLECPEGLAAELVEAVDGDGLSFPVVISIESAELDEKWRVDSNIEEAE